VPANGTRSAAGSDGPVDRVEIGAVARAHGVRGELRVVLHNPTSTALDGVDAVFVGERELALESARPVAGGAYLVRLAGIGDRDQAEALRGAPVAVARADLPLADDEVLLVDLVGCRVELADGTSWGVIAAVETGPQDRLVIHSGDVERQLPVTDAFLIDIDLDARRVVVDPPEGLPEEPIRRR
jgi:16S rRNA processing protein RimM